MSQFNTVTSFKKKSGYNPYTAEAKNATCANERRVLSLYFSIFACAVLSLYFAILALFAETLPHGQREKMGFFGEAHVSGESRASAALRQNQRTKPPAGRGPRAISRTARHRVADAPLQRPP